MRAMPPACIFVSVIGFSDVERHALNTLFRLSRDGAVAYAPWEPLTAPGVPAPTAQADVLLIDGACAEAVMAQARAVPAGPRLIWVGPGAPEQAWRVLDRPIRWAELLDDLDAVYAARQAGLGGLDLDVSAPMPLDVPEPTRRRALLVGLAPTESALLHQRLALRDITEVDEAGSTEAALDLMGRHAYVCGVFDLDDPHFDGWSLAQWFARRHPHALNVGLSQHAGPLAGWWRRRRVRRDTRRVGIHALLPKPMPVAELGEWLGRL